MGAPRMFNDDQVREIRACTLSRKEAAELYGTSTRTIDQIKLGRIYDNVPGPASVPCRCMRTTPTERKMSDDMIRELRANHEGLTFQKLGMKFNVSTHAAYEAYHGFTYKEVR